MSLPENLQIVTPSKQTNANHTYAGLVDDKKTSSPTSSPIPKEKTSTSTTSPNIGSYGGKVPSTADATKGCSLEVKIDSLHALIDSLILRARENMCEVHFLRLELRRMQNKTMDKLEELKVLIELPDITVHLPNLTPPVSRTRPPSPTYDPSKQMDTSDSD